MRIVASRVIRVAGTSAGPVGTLRAPLATRCGLVLILTSETGLEGIGEASPLPGYSPDTIELAEKALDGIHHALAGLQTERGAAAAIARATSPAARELEGAPSARFAVESALLDLLGRFYRLPAHRLLGARSPSPVPRSVLLPPPAHPGASLAARQAIGRGIHTLKLKLGERPFEEELAALVRLRAELGPDVELRLDANGGFGADAPSRLQALAAVRPAYVEEPVSGADLLALLPGAVPIAADESLADPAVAAALLAHPGLGAVVVKPALLGLLRARSIANAAARRRLPVVVTHLFDGPVALAACAELALSLAAPAACGLDPHPGLAAFPTLPLPQFESPDAIVPGTAPGLGVPSEGEEAVAWLL